MNGLRRVISLLLCLTLVVGILPMSIWAAEESTEETPLDAAVFVSDIHGSTSDANAVFGGVATSGLTFSSASFVGDTCLSVSTVEGILSTQLGHTPSALFSYAASHDTENSADISKNWNFSGEAFENDYYTVYTICETDMENASDAATAVVDFNSWVETADTGKPLFIISHRPMHERRNDNAGAADWYEAISAAAETMDIVFLWGHNHTGESSVDRAAYYVAKDGSETITVEGGSTVTPNFTYMTAGYVNANGQNPSRINVATTVRIYADRLEFQDYGESGEYTGTYAHTATVDFEFASLSSVTPTQLAVTGAIEYTVGDTVQNPSEIVVTYSDGSTKSLSASDLTCVITDATGTVQTGTTFTAAGTYNLIYSYTENGATATAILVVTVKLGETTVTCWDDYDTLSVSATAVGLTGISAANVSGDLEVLNEVFSDHAALDVTLEGHTDGNSVKYSILFFDDMDTANLGVYHVADDGTLTPIAFELVTTESGTSYVEFTTTLTGTFAYGNIAVPDGYELDSISVSNAATKYLVGDSLNLTSPFAVIATYKKSGSDDFTRVLYVYEENNNPDGYTVDMDSFDMTTAGTYSVKIVYGDLSTTFDIRVYDKVFPDESTGVSVEVNVPGTTEITVKEISSSNGTVSGAVSHLVSNYVAYDIELSGYNDGETVTVTLPIPSGVEDPAVYYVSDDGKTVTNMHATDNGDGTVSFETDHFSTYVVGESTEIEVPDPTTQTVTGATTTEKKTVYVLSSSISSGKSYLIVNGNAAGSYYALANNSGSVVATGVTVKTDSSIGTYIELDDATDELWTTSGSSSTSLKNGSYYLTYSGSRGNYSLDLSTSSTNWTYSSNRLSIVPNRTTYYVVYDSGWDISSSSDNIYFYVPTEIDVTTSANGTYLIAGNPDEITKVVVEGSTATLGSTLTFVPESGTTTTTDTSSTATYTVVDGGDPNGIIDTISGNTVTFSGAYGKALVKVSYTVTVNSTDYTVDNYIVVTASAPYYEVAIQDEDGKTVSGTTISLKGITNGQTVDLSEVITQITSDGSGPVTPEDGSVEWSIPTEYQSIATVDQNGVVTLKGVDGAFYVMVTYTKDGKDYTTGVNFSVTTSQYSVPSDGTSDFPEYPNEGAIRFDKTATAVGNFSETGIAQVELSMTGVPYTTGSEIDVVMMLDITGSMTDGDALSSYTYSKYPRVEYTILAAQAFVESIVVNEDGSYNKNRVGVYSFNSGGTYTLFDLGTISSDTELTAAKAAIATLYDDYKSGGTPYDDGLAKVQSVLSTAKTDGTGNDRQQFAVFMTDGVPTSYAYVNGTTYGTHSSANSIAGMLTSSDNYATRDTDYKYEYYSTEMKADDVTVYTVGIGLENTNSAWSGTATQCLNLASRLLNDISGPAGESEQPDAVGTSTLSKQDSYFFSVADSDAATEMENVFTNIAVKILNAATNVVVQDKIADDYTMVFDIPTGSQNISGLDSQEFYIEVKEYTLDANHERTTTYTSLAKVYLGVSNGTYYAASDASGTAYASPVFTAVTDEDTKAYWSVVDSTYTAKAGEIVINVNGTYYKFIADGSGDYNMTSGAYAYGTIDSDTNMSTDLVIVTPYFAYSAATRMLAWTAEKLTTTELALSYFLYLDQSATEIGTPDEVAAGPYETNDWATITYTNFNGNDCQQEFPVPQMTWNGAQVSYVFYLVNEAGQPINKSGQVVDFANATFITEVFTESVVWNKDGTEGETELNIEYLAQDLLPSAYTIYDENAEYTIHVYQDASSNSVFDYFIIEGSPLNTVNAVNGNTVQSVTTTKVYNTKAGTKYAAYGTYSAEAVGTNFTTTDANGNTVTITTTHQASMDYSDTTVAFAVLWKPALVEDTVVVDFGLDVLINVVQNDILQNTVSGIGLGTEAYGNTAMNTGVSTTSKLGTAALTVGGYTISIENENAIRFHQNSMEFSAPVKFYYESPVEFYEGSNKQTGYMYSSVTVIPATTIYYEDEYVTLTTYTSTDGGSTFTGTSGWPTDSVKATATQDQDRPGADQLGNGLDADNVYGYDSAYANQSTFSMGNAAMITVNANTYGTAEFTFYGTGFDVIALTSSQTGVLVVQVRDLNNSNKLVASRIVDTYYGYVYDEETDTWSLTTDTDNALYQVPVIQVENLAYGHYSVTLTASYYDALNNQGATGEDGKWVGDGSYDLYLDAIRIYDPAGTTYDEKDSDGNVTTEGDIEDVIQDAYIADKEGWPIYQELRNNVIDAAELTTDGTTQVAGIVFMDGVGESAVVSDYINCGPNNELYLAPGQAIAFNLELNSAVAAVQLGIKSADGSTVSYKIFDGATITDSTSVDAITAATVATATDMYYDITSLKDETIVIYNSGDSGILSLTNIKVTHTADPGDAGSLFYVSADVISKITENMNTDPTFTPEKLEVSTSSNVYVGNKIVVTVKTGTDVEAISVDDTLVTNYYEFRGVRTWYSRVSAETAGEQTVSVVAYDENGYASESVEKTVTVKARANSVIGQIIDKFKDWFGWN